MIQHSYDKVSVEELLAWARKCLETGSYPKEEFALDESSVILDCHHYLNAMITMITNNWENATFHPLIAQLREFREKIEATH